MSSLKASLQCSIARHSLAKPTPGWSLPTRTQRQSCVVRSKDELKDVSSAPPVVDVPEVTSSVTAPAEVPGQMSYPLVTALAAAGVLETTYLTIVKLSGAPLVCPVSGCETVLNSQYSSLFGLPLSLFGMLAYGAVGLLSAVATGEKRKLQDVSRGDDAVSDAERATRLTTYDNGLMAGASLLAGCSSVLMYLLFTQFGGEPCIWCYTSAAISLSLLGVVAAGMSGRQLKEAAMPGLGAVATAVLVLNFGFGGLASPSNAANSDFQLDYYKPDITTDSTERTKSLAKKLKEAGAKMYGAFWCTHCYDQKQTFGAAAMKNFPYVECYPDGWKRGVKEADACEAAGVRAFPTWVINGKLIEGQLSLDEVEAALEGKEAPAPAPAPAAQ